MQKISEEETKKRFQKLRNYEHLHSKQKERNEMLKQKNTTLTEQKRTLEQESKQQAQRIQTLELQLEELRAMKFGKKRSNQKVSPLSLPSKIQEGHQKEHTRKPESYRRPLPSPSEITDTIRMEIKTCPECGQELTNKKDHTHYREDLKKTEERLKEIKRIIEVTVESGICNNKNCNLFRQKSFAREVPKQKVIIGENLRQMIVYLSVIMGQSYSEIEKNLNTLYNIHISSGHIANILHGESILLTPYYNFLIESLREEGCTQGAHYDETTWKSGSQGKEISEGNYCWVKTGVLSKNQLIWFGQGRGKDVAERLRGEKENTLGVTDNYGSYTHLFDHHQLCWAHPHRKLRDLAESTVLNNEPNTNQNQKIQKQCKKAFTDFKEVYKKSRKLREDLLNNTNPLTEKQKTKRQKQIQKLFTEICKERKDDPEKLQKIRESLARNKEKYFTFLKHPSLPLDNNKAERAIRKIVIRRKKTLGCKSPKAANVLSILYSVLFSLTENSPEKNFFELYNEAVGFEGQ